MANPDGAGVRVLGEGEVLLEASLSISVHLPGYFKKFLCYKILFFPVLVPSRMG
jgi:hypothetical protein